MNKKTRIKLQATEHDVPQSLADVNEAVAEIGRRQRERDRIQAEMNDNLAAVRAEYEAMARPHAERIAALTHGVAMYCEANRDALTKGGKTKTARLATGEISWRTRPPSVVVRGMEAVIDALHRLKLDRFLRVKTELDKDAILAEPEAVDAIKGLSISQKEDFVIKPDSTELEEVR
jgi:phage host-nuclease inhibitor protein Gam